MPIWCRSVLRAMTRRSVLPAICLCALGWAAPAAQATSTWLAAQTVSNPLEPVTGTEQTVTMGPRGDIAAVWIDAGGVVAGVRPAGASSFSQETVSTPGDAVGYPKVAVNASGTVVAAWADGTAGQYEVAIRPAGGAFSAPIQAGPTGGSLNLPTSVAIDNAGDVLVGETDEVAGKDVAAYAWQPAGGSFTTTTIDEPGREANLPVVAVDEAGDAVLAWEERSSASSSSTTIARAITRPAAGAFGAAQTLTSAAEYAFNITVAVGAGGQAAVAWQRGDTTPPYRIEASTSAGPQDLLTLPQAISAEGANGEYPAVGVGGNGEVIAAWEQGSAANEVASASAGGAFTPATQLSATGGDPQIALDAAGDAVIGWGAAPEGVQGEYAIVRSAGGALGPEDALSAPGEELDSLSGNVPATTVGMDSAGEAVAAWGRKSDHTVQARLYQAVSEPTAVPPPGHPILIPCADSLAFRTATSSCPLIPVCRAALARAEGSGSTGHPACAILAPRCRVPRLEGLSKTAAKRRLLAADCKLGKVRVAKRYRHTRRLVVATQSAKAGTRHLPGTSVSLTLKPAPPRHKRRRR